MFTELKHRLPKDSPERGAGEPRNVPAPIGNSWSLIWEPPRSYTILHLSLIGSILCVPIFHLYSS
jgi:hypothetical protein